MRSLEGSLMNKRLITMVVALVILASPACEAATPPAPETSSGDSQGAAYAAAQATLAAGRSELMALSSQATVVSLNMEQAANAVAQATVDHNQRQLMELSLQSTAVSQDMARAAATQQAIADQTQMVENATATAQSQASTARAQDQAATATAQSQAATATYSAYVLDVTQTAQVQEILDTRAAGKAQAHATLTAYPLTATPEAGIQAEIVRNREERVRRSLWEEFVVTPLRLALSIVIVVLLIVGGVMAYLRLMPVLEYRLRNPRENGTTDPSFPMDCTIVDLDPHQHPSTRQELPLLKQPQLPLDGTPRVEIIDASDPSIINWVTEAESRLRTDGRIHL